MFKREDRYIVFKKSDLDDNQLKVLLEWRKTVQKNRLNNGKDFLECVVIESDWPEYETVWETIQLRMEYPYFKTPQQCLEDMDHETLLKTAKEYYSIISIHMNNK